VPVVHFEVPDRMYPALQLGLQVAPCGSEAEHDPILPFVGAADASHELGLHVTAVSRPFMHDVFPETVYPALQVGAQVDPEASLAVQVPLKPFAGAAEASQEFSTQVARVNLPAVQELWPETW
jgi:hypothetical protein